jgi:hypothetical protein
LLQFLDRPDAAGRLMTAIGGFVFEDHLKERAAKEFLSVEDVSRKKLPYDLVINGRRVQCKSSGSRSGCVDVRPSRPVVGSDCRRYSAADFDVMAVHLAAFGEVFFLPTDQFMCDQYAGMVCGTFVRSKCIRWLDAWCVIRDGQGATCRQKTLWG